MVSRNEVCQIIMLFVMANRFVLCLLSLYFLIIGNMSIFIHKTKNSYCLVKMKMECMSFQSGAPLSCV